MEVYEMANVTGPIKNMIDSAARAIGLPTPEEMGMPVPPEPAVALQQMQRTVSGRLGGGQ
jgi:hypothetical protein